MSSYNTNTNSNDDRAALNLFGFEIKRARKVTKKNLESVVPPVDEDGSGYVTAAGAHYGTYVNVGDDAARAKDDAQLIRQYRAVSHHPEVDAAVEDIVNEAISTSDNEAAVNLNLDNVKLSDSVKKKITEEFGGIISMLKFNELGHDIFKRWYIDGRLYYHLVVDENNPKQGIQEARPIDAAKTRKVKQIKRKKDPATGANIIEKVDEFYIYQDKPGTVSNQGVKLSPDSVTYCTSGLLDEQRKRVVSHLHKALKPINQLRMMEDSLVIYRLARAPERRVFYIDVGNLPKAKAEEYMKKIMAQYRNKLVYDASTGQIRDDRKHMSMLEDLWLPRREGGRGTEISTLPGGENLGQIDDIIYFQKRLYRSLNVPINRLEQEAQFSLGRSTEITRDELKFQKFIDRLRSRFNMLFYDILKKQLLLKGIITEEDWQEIQEQVIVDYARDSHFTELKEAELFRERVQTLDMVQAYINNEDNAALGFFSKEWVYKNILHFTDDQITEIKKQMKDESAAGEANTPEMPDGQQQVSQPEPQPDDQQEQVIIDLLSKTLGSND